MKCPKCKRRMLYEPPCFEGDTGSQRCPNCSTRIWDEREVTMPGVPPVEDARSYPGNAANLQKAREAKLAGIRAKQKELLMQVAEMDEESRMVG